MMPRGETAGAPSDEELARRAQQGCSDSFEELVRRFQVRLLHFLRRYVNLADAEDLVQDTFIRAYRNLDRYRPTYRFATWLYTIARRLSLNRLRQKRPLVDSDVLDSVRAKTAPPAQQVGAEEDRQQLWGLAAEVLNERQLTAVWLYYVEEMPVIGIARVLGRSRMAIKTMLFRARKKLMPVLRELNPHGPAKDRTRSLEASSC